MVFKKMVTQNAGETQKLAERIAKSLKGGQVLALCGELGSGKTTFVQGLAKGLGIKKRIISPTFVFIRQYKISPPRSHFVTPRRCCLTTPPRWIFYHVDLYRINSLKEITGLGLEEILNDPQNIVAIEWAEKIEKILPSKRWDIKFEYLSEQERKIMIKRTA